MYKNLGTLCVEGFSWTNNEKDPTLIDIKYGGDLVMRITLHEAIQYTGRKNVLRIVKDLDNSPWIKPWQAEKHNELIDILKA